MRGSKRRVYVVVARSERDEAIQIASLQSLDCFACACNDGIWGSYHLVPTKHMPMRETSLITWQASPLAQVHDLKLKSFSLALALWL
jgi:hypothetical protein